MVEQEVQMNKGENEIFDFSHITAVVMAGGQGTRLQEVTKGLVPKDFVVIDHDTGMRGVDITRRHLQSLGITNVIYSANHFLPLYEAELAGEGYKFHYQAPGDCHGLDFMKILGEQGCSSTYQYLLLSTDNLFSTSDLRDLLATHNEGTITRGVAPFQFDDQEQYYHLHVDSRTGAIVGDDRSGYFTCTDLDAITKYTASPIAVVDPGLFEETFAIYKRLCKKEDDIDFWLDIGFLLAEQNRRNLLRNRESFYNAHVFKGSLVDYGTPKTLELARRVYKEEGFK